MEDLCAYRKRGLPSEPVALYFCSQTRQHRKGRELSLEQIIQNKPGRNRKVAGGMHFIAVLVSYETHPSSNTKNNILGTFSELKFSEIKFSY